MDEVSGVLDALRVDSGTIQARPLGSKSQTGEPRRPTCRFPPQANDSNTTGARRLAAKNATQSRRDPSEASPRPTSPQTQCRPTKVLGEQHCLLMDVRPRPVKHQKGRGPTRGGMGLQPSQKERGKGISNSNRKRINMLGIRTESPPGQRYYRRPADATPAPQSSRRGTPPARGCTPAAGQASKRKETCAGRDGAETESKRKRKGCQELKQKRKDKHVGNTFRTPPPPRLTILILRERASGPPEIQHD